MASPQLMSLRVISWNVNSVRKGRRLDHIWVTPALGDSLQAAEVIKRARGWEPASDHAPVVVTLDKIAPHE